MRWDTIAPMMIVTVIGLIFTYLVSSLVIFLAAARFTRVTRSEVSRLFFLTAGLGPIIISVLLTRFYQFLPHRSDAFYLAGVGVCFLPLLILGRRKLHLAVDILADARAFLAERISRKHWPGMIILALAIILTVGATIQGVWNPLTSQDPLGYATLSRLIHKYGNVAFYPSTEADPQTGFYYPSSHPLAYPALIAWHYMLQGTGEYAGLMKIIAPIYTIHGLLLLWHLLANRGRFAGPMAMLLFIGTPWIYNLPRSCHIDPLRVYVFLLAFVWLRELLRRPGRAWTVLAGIAVGASIFSHSAGLLTLPFFAFIYFIKAREAHAQRLVRIAAVCAIAMVLGGPRYLQHFIAAGSPVSDDTRVWSMPELGYKEYLRLDRGLATQSERLFNGVLKGFTKLRYFGLTHWVCAAAVVFGLKRILTDELSSVFLWVLILFYGLVAITFVIGMDLVIKNDRYFITVQPFIAYHGGLFLGHLNDKFAKD